VCARGRGTDCGGEHVRVIKALVAGKNGRKSLRRCRSPRFSRRAFARFGRAIEIYERLGDRRGVMSAVVAMAALSWGPGIHLTGSVQHIEEIRRLSGRLKSSPAGERALADVQMLFGAHVYARNRGFADLH